ncbi:hypothetical protein BEH94_10240 [Candidatus Altiarchaeales archaeon WOR_SM1_SCG]|nr:hypothetical protein BEH94_10240 [Candidatus Altiarchaeales archaeon WOR_SM1_SCG]
MERYLYHETEYENLPSIMVKGLIPKRPKDKKEVDHRFPKGVYLQKKRPKSSSSIFVILKINVRRLNVLPDPDTQHEQDQSFYTPEPIDPSRITEIFGLTKKVRAYLNPQQFGKIFEDKTYNTIFEDKTYKIEIKHKIEINKIGTQQMKLLTEDKNVN